MKNLSLLIVAFCLFSTSLFSDIQQIIINWQSGCDKQCSETLKKRLEKISQIENLSMDPGSNTAVIEWKKNTRFTMTPIINAASYVGVHINVVRVKTSGKVNKEGNNFWLISSGDNTKFRLLGPWKQKEGQFAPIHSSASWKLTDEQKSKLTQLDKSKEEATFKGPLYLPYRASPYELILEN